VHKFKIFIKLNNEIMAKNLKIIFIGGLLIIFAIVMYWGVIIAKLPSNLVLNHHRKEQNNTA